MSGLGGVPILGQPADDWVAIQVIMPSADGKNLVGSGFRVPRLLITAPALMPDDVRQQTMTDIHAALWQVLGQLFALYQQSAQEVNGHAPAGPEKTS